MKWERWAEQDENLCSPGMIKNLFCWPECLSGGLGRGEVMEVLSRGLGRGLRFSSASGVALSSFLQTFHISNPLWAKNKGEEF